MHSGRHTQAEIQRGTQTHNYGQSAIYSSLHPLMKKVENKQIII